MKRPVIIIAIIVFFSMVVAGIYFYLFPKQPSQPLNLIEFKETDTKVIEDKILNHSPCLAEDEFVENSLYFDNRIMRPDTPKFPVTIFVGDLKTKEEKYSFQIENVAAGAYPTQIQIHKCGVYVIKSFDLGEKYPRRKEIWRYTFDGKGEMLMSHADLSPYTYTLQFCVNVSETYIALVRGPHIDFGHAIDIKDLETMKDTFVLTMEDLVEIYEKKYKGTFTFLPGTFSFFCWFKDYLTFEVAKTHGNPWFRLYTNTWELEMTSPPFDGFPLPIPATIDLRYLKLK